MGYCFNSREAVEAGIKRIVGEQIDAAIAQLGRDAAELDEAVHDARKCFKKIRGVLSLVGDEPKRIRRARKQIRDVARRLSGVRDAGALIGTLDGLLERSGDGSFDGLAVRGVLIERRDELIETAHDMPRLVATAVDDLQQVKADCRQWKIKGKGFAAIAGGFKNCYAGGRQALADVEADETPERFHELRKSVKTSWYQVRVLQRAWPPLLKAERRLLKRLSEQLGDDHDLTVLRQTLIDEPDRFREVQGIETLLELIDGRQAELRRQAVEAARQFYAEKPAARRRRFAAYWRNWRRAARAPRPQTVTVT